MAEIINLTLFFSSSNISPPVSSSHRVKAFINWMCCIHFSVRRGLNQEAECCTWDPTSSHDLRKWERGAHRDGQHAAERREQTAPGHRQAPGPHTCHRGLCHPGRSWAVPRVCKCLISALLAARHDKQPRATATLSSVLSRRELSAGKH